MDPLARFLFRRGHARDGTRVGIAILVAFLVLIVPLLRAENPIRIEEVQGQPYFAFDFAGAADFSAIAWAGGEKFFIISDKQRAVFPLEVAFDLKTGRIESATVGTPLAVKAKAADFEGLAMHGDGSRFLISTEQPAALLDVDRKTGAAAAVPVPDVFRRTRANKGFEGLARDGTTGFLWLANEEALDGDGAVSGRDAGTVVRLQRFDRRLRAAGQFAYRTGTAAWRRGGGTGVTELLALPGGPLLVLERVIGSFGMSAQIFAVDPSGATDLSSIARLDGVGFRPVAKMLIFSRATLATNFEGMTLGPQLAGGWRSLLLVADSGGGTRHVLMPLRIRW